MKKSLCLILATINSNMYVGQDGELVFIQHDNVYVFKY